MNKHQKHLLCALLCAACFMPTNAEARYRSGTDTGVEILDYIENQRRGRRENRLTEEQIQLVKDAKEMRKNLRQPLSKDPNAQLPVAIEGDDLFYDQTTGDVYARGAVTITQLDAERFTTEEARGNLKKQEVTIDGKGHMVKMTPGEPPLYMDGYKIVYDYGKRTGRMSDAIGKVGNFHVAGRRIELYPERVLVYDGYETKCSAKTPDYRVSGDLIEIYPGSEMIIYEAKFWLKDKILFTKAEERIDLSETDEQRLPTVGFDSDYGAWISYKFAYDILPRTEAYFNLLYYNRIRSRNLLGMKWSNGGNTISVESGQYEDSDNRWMRKKPVFKYSYTNKVGSWPFRYTLSYERGKWSRRGVSSMHTAYSFYLSRNVLEFLPNWKLIAGIGYDITKEGYNHSKVKGLRYDATIMHDIGEDITAYVGYHYKKATSKNSLYDFGLDSYSNKFQFGISWAITDRDRIVFGQKFDAKEHKQKDIDYYWFHNMHCAELIFRYRAHQKSWHVTLQFAPW